MAIPTEDNKQLMADLLHIAEDLSGRFSNLPEPLKELLAAVVPPASKVRH
jgi:hypothetical protein